MKHIVIDEAQDFSVFQLYVLKKIIKDSSFTILGDLCQGIHSYRGITDWKDISDYVFSDRKSEFLTLDQSYRTTVEIMEAANMVMKKLPGKNIPFAKPVIRHGEKVNIFIKDTIDEIVEDISSQLLHLKSSYSSAAVICKSEKECKKMLSRFQKSGIPINLLSNKDEVYKGGMVIVPSYLAKGLEFDVVIIANAAKDMYTEDELDIKLLYVAMTRALHKLYIYSLSNISPLLQESSGV